MTAALIYVLLHSLIVAEARRDDGKGRCTAVQLSLLRFAPSLSKLRRRRKRAQLVPLWMPCTRLRRL
jgi:hypothetical protein